jgi:membrane protein DedA with SNARE-associated domain
MLENILNFIQHLPGIYVLLIAFAFSLIENLFPPSPSDTVIVFSATLIPSGNVHFAGLLVFSTLGSVVGFLIMFSIGLKFERSVIETKKFKYIPIDAVLKVENWFQKWGYWVIVANRFLSGTRAVVSFFAGMSNLKVRKTTILSAVSALAWNFILIFVGMEFSKNWKEIYTKIESYGNIIFIVIVTIIVFFIAKYIYNKKKKHNIEK